MARLGPPQATQIVSVHLTDSEYRNAPLDSLGVTKAIYGFMAGFNETQGFIRVRR